MLQAFFAQKKAQKYDSAILLPTNATEEYEKIQ